MYGLEEQAHSQAQGLPAVPLLTSNESLPLLHNRYNTGT